MLLKVLHRGFNFSQDGPGNRLVYHLQGCNFHCPWCSNPESIALGGSLITGAEISYNCPFGAISSGALDRSVCNGCTERGCLKVYSSGIKLSCYEADTDEIVSEVKRSSAMFFDGGGVTFTGGEATVQFDALKEALTKIRAAGFNTALETNASSNRLPELFGLVDCLMVDFKHYDSKKHREIIGVGNENVLKNIRLALRDRAQLSIRIPLINGFNASLSDAQSFAAALTDAGANRNKGCCIELLSYHEYGRDKWRSCGMEYTVENAHIDEAQFADFVSVLKEKGFRLIRT